MDLRAYYQKIREAEAAIADVFAIVVSLETPDGGKAGIVNEVSRGTAAKMLVDGIARLAKPEEATDFQAQQAEAVRLAEQQTLTRQVQLSVVPTSELNQLKAAVLSLQE